MISIKSSRELVSMRSACKIVAETHEKLKEVIKPGITTKELDQIAEEYIRKCGAIPAFKGYRGFPASICASVNEQVIHGIPGPITLNEGDIVGVDIGAVYDGFYGDAARTHGVGNISDIANKLIRVTEECFYMGMKFARVGYRISDISNAIQRHAEQNGFSVVREYIGHGIGRNMHEEPDVPNYGPPGRGPRLHKGMTLAVEPMVNVGGYATKTLDDGWTVVTLDGSLSAHYENTIAITDAEPEIMTLL